MCILLSKRGLIRAGYQQPASNTTFNSKGSDMNKSIENTSSCKIDQIARKYLKDSDNDTIRQALEVVMTDRNVSVSHLQKQLRVGYNRAVEVVEGRRSGGSSDRVTMRTNGKF